MNINQIAWFEKFDICMKCMYPSYSSEVYTIVCRYFW